jgi:hypothetical protein
VERWLEVCEARGVPVTDDDIAAAQSSMYQIAYAPSTSGTHETAEQPEEEEEEEDDGWYDPGVPAVFVIPVLPEPEAIREAYRRQGPAKRQRLE